MSTTVERSDPVKYKQRRTNTRAYLIAKLTTSHLPGYSVTGHRTYITKDQDIYAGVPPTIHRKLWPYTRKLDKNSLRKLYYIIMLMLVNNI